MKNILNKWVGLNSGELGKTVGMFLYLLMAVGTYVIGRIVRDSLFLSRYDFSYLPYMYVWVALAMATFGYIYSHFADRFPRDRLVWTVTSILVVLVAIARVILSFQQDWFYPVLYVFIEVMGSVLIIQFWTFANDLFNTREGKRLFGPIGIGGVIATIGTGFLVNGLAQQVKTANLLFLCCGLLIGCLGVVSWLSKAYHHELISAFGELPKSQKAISISADFEKVFSSRHLKTIAWMVLLTFIVVTLVDYQFKFLVRNNFLNREDQLSAFLGMFYAVTGVLSFFVQTLLTSKVLKCYGIVISLMLLPAFLFGGSLLLLLLPTIMAATFLKGAENVLRYTIHDTAVQVLYLPVPGQIRGRAKTFIDGILKPMAQGMCGLTLAWAASWTGHRVHWLSVGTLICLGILMVLIVRSKKQYLQALVGTLQQRKIHWGDSHIFFSDAQSVEVLHQALFERDENQVLHALEMLPQARQHDWSSDLEKLLEHGSPRVRLQAIHQLKKEGTIRNIEKILQHIRDPDEDVRAEAVVSYCATMKEKAMSVVEPLLEETSVRVQASAAMGLIRYGGLEGVILAAETLKAMLGSTLAERRKAGSWVIGKVGVKTFFRSLIPLLSDPDPSVRLEAVRAAHALRSPDLLMPLIYRLEDAATKKAAILALGSYGPAIIMTLRTILNNPREEQQVRQGICQVLSLIGDQLSMDILSNILDNPQTDLRNSALDAIVKLQIRFPHLRRDKEMLRRTLKQELKNTFQLKVIAHETASLENILLQDDLHHLFSLAISRVSKILKVIYPRRHIETIFQNLNGNSPIVRANSLELLDNILDLETRQCLIPILEEPDPAHLIQCGDELFPLLHLTATAWLHKLLLSDHEWTVVCALDAVRNCRSQDFEPIVRMLLNHPSTLIRETAVFCMLQLVNHQGSKEA